jgi:hypothetical protein
MAINFGGVSCDIIRVVAYTTPTARVHPLEIPGRTGMGQVVTHTGPGRVQFELVKVDTDTNVTTWRRAVEARKGTDPLSAEDSAGRAYTSSLVFVAMSVNAPIPVYADGVAKVLQTIRVEGGVNP